jgi:hypothetical protein
MHGVQVTNRVERPAYVWVAIGLQLATSLLAIPVGRMMVRDPDGPVLGMPQAWIDATPFASWLVPGLFLFAVNGVGQLSAAVFAIVRHPLAPWLTGALGVGLMAWIAVQVVLMPPHPLQPTLFLVGLVEGLVALGWLRSLGRHTGQRRALLSSSGPEGA